MWSYTYAHQLHDEIYSAPGVHFLDHLDDVGVFELSEDSHLLVDHRQLIIVALSQVDDLERHQQSPRSVQNIQ